MYSRELIFRREPNYLIFWLIVVIIITFFIMGACFYKYNPYYATSGIYKEEEKNVLFILETSKIFNIRESEIVIDRNIIDKNNLHIGDYIYSDNKIYNNISIHLENDVDERIVSIFFKLPKTTLLNELKKGLMK